MGASPQVTITPDATPKQAVTITPDPPQRTWKDSVSDFGQALWSKVNPVTGIKGAMQMAEHPIDALKGDASARQQVYDQAEDAFKKGNYSEGAAHLLYAALPFIGPQLNEAGNDLLQGKVAKGLGASTGLGISMAAPEALGKLKASIPGAGEVASKIYEGTLKPSTTLTTAEREGAVKTGLAEGIPVSKAGAEKISTAISNLNDKVKAQITAGSAAGATVSKYDIVKRLAGTSKRFKEQVNPEADLRAISESGKEFLRNQPDRIPAGKAQDLKAGTYKQLTSKAYGEMSTASVEAQKALARGIKEELEQQFPEIGSLNARESKLLDLDEILDKSLKRIGNRNIFGLMDTVATTGAAGAGGVVAHGAGAATGVAAGLLYRVLRDPAVSSRLAVALSRTGIPRSMANTRIATYVNALGQFAPKATGGIPQVATATAGQ